MSLSYEESTDASRQLHGEFGDDLVAAMADGGADALFYCSGSDIMFYQEAVAKRQAHGQEEPALYTMTHEIVCLNAAMGYTAVTGRPSVTASHVDLGTLNHGSAIHGAARARLPILMTAGMPPTATPATMRGARDEAHFWAQQTADQNGIVRQYVKWEHMLTYQDNPGTVVSRALQVAGTAPEGPVYLSLPREVPMLRRREDHYATVQDLAIPVASEPTSESSQWVLSRLLTAQHPVLILGLSGRHPEATRLVGEFADFFGITVVDGGVYSYQGISFAHPCYRREDDLSLADLVIVLESPIPWLPGSNEPRDGTDIVVVDTDPIVQGFPLMEFPASLRIPVSAETFLGKILDAAKQSLAATELSRLTARRDRVARNVATFRRQIEDSAATRFREDVIDPVWAAYQVAQNIPADARVLDDTIFSAPVHRFLAVDGPLQYLRRPSSSGGWGVGAALGAKLGDPDRTTVLVTGDGFYMFGVPTCALWAARAYAAPFLTVVFQNDSYNTGTEETVKHYPGGFAAAAGYPGGYLDPSVDFAVECGAVGAYGENVYRPRDIAGAMKRGFEAVDSGRCAVIVIKLPRLLELPERKEDR